MTTLRAAIAVALALASFSAMADEATPRTGRGDWPIGVAVPRPMSNASPSEAPTPPTAPAPTLQALGTMLRQSQNREAEALVQVFTLRAQLDAATKRAEAAEAKIPKPATPKD